ncbi:hypothetical protein CC78DRAFT_584928 [Lojkania enalia]|uniref:Uncharacterized protein n=1 Tax=Lojkania enalia TaxID=147567 RepID=A0A9P4K587_9PLEO|nr:hypothetical protein CC78DRAFT_584928 [Didymosphaeria enalia]
MSGILLFNDIDSRKSQSLELPRGDCSAPPIRPKTIFYLTITTPHTNSFTIHSPKSTFAALIPTIKSAIIQSPAAVNELDTLKLNVRKPSQSADSILNAPVYGFVAIQSPVYVVTAHGPLYHDKASEYVKIVQSGRPKGMAERSGLVGSFVDV